MERKGLGIGKGRFVCFAAVCSVAMLMLFDSSSSAHAATSAQIRVLQSDASRVILELEFSNYKMDPTQVGGKTYTMFSASGLNPSMEVGKPQLPLKSALIGIPPGAQASLKIAADDSQRIALVNSPIPVPADQIQRLPDQALPMPASRTYAPDAATYSANQFYPADAARVGTTGAWRSATFAAIEFHPFQYNPVTRELIVHRRLRVEVTFNYPGGQTRAAMGGVVNEGAFETTLQKSLLNYAVAKNWRAKTLPAKMPAARAARSYTAGAWYKVGVNADGIYQVTCAQLASAGIAIASLDLNTLKIYKQGNEIAITAVGQCSGGGNGYLEFFGQAAHTLYTNTNMYWLTFGGSAGKRMTTRSGSGGGTPPTSFVATTHIEQDLLYRSSYPMVEGADHWFWNYLTNLGSGDYPFQLASPASGASSATLQARFVGINAGMHRTQISINGNLINDATWSGTAERVATVSFPQTYLQAGTNTIRVSEADSTSSIFVNNFDLSYASAFTATSDALRFRVETPGAWRYQIDGFTNATLETFDITDTANPVIVAGAAIAPVGANYKLQFSDTLSAPREYIALASAQRKTPVSLTRDTPSDLRNTSNGADYIAIAYGGFIPNLQPLAAWRAGQGMRVQVVDVQDVYDEFSDGLMDAQAIYDFLAYAYANWQSPAPAFVLLVGDGNYDFKNNLGTGEPNFIPPYLRFVDYWLGETASDNRYVTFNPANNLPSMAIGRLPADSAADVDGMVAKILANEQTPTGDWAMRTTFIADNADAAGDFPYYSDLIATDSAYLPAPHTAERIYYNQAPYTTADLARNAIVSDINKGTLIVNYVGHGFVNSWAGEQLFNLTSLNSLSNSKFPVMLSLSCYVGYFHIPNYPSLGEASVRARNGMLASWSSAGLGMAAAQDFLDRGFFEAVMQQGLTQIGPATIYSKMYLWLVVGDAYRDSIDAFTLFGDPASRLASVPGQAISTPTATATNTPTATATSAPSATPMTTSTPIAIPTKPGKLPPDASVRTIFLPSILK